MPVARMKLIVGQLGIADAPCQLAISSTSMEGVASSLVPRVIRVGGDKDWEKDISTIEQASWKIEPTDVAYVIFTSGTTGVPKGVVVEHRSICTCAVEAGKRAGFAKVQNLRHAQYLSWAFDGSLFETFYPLVFGGCVCLLSNDERMDDVGGAFTRMRVTHGKFTPSICDQLNPADFPTLNVLYLGGEPLTEAVAGRWTPTVDVVNCYGPAECTVLCFMISARESQWRSGMIGRPVGTRCWITDPKNPNRRLPRGFLGELLIEGPLVSQGYLRNLEQTSSRAFVEDLIWAPKTAEGPRRFYRTGDTGFVDANGLFTCKGRTDLQVKIRGQRIELGEVESRVQSWLPESAKAVVDAVTVQGNKVLVAFIQLAEISDHLSTFQDQVERLRSRATEALPPAFQPSSYVRVDKLPRGPTGKTDRKKLKAMIGEISMNQLLRLTEIRAEPGDNTATRAPFEKSDSLTQGSNQSEISRTLRHIWSNVLGRNAIEIDNDSDFFSCGGNSLLAIKVVSLARASSIDLTVRLIFENPTLEGLAGATSFCVHQEVTPSKEAPPEDNDQSDLKAKIAFEWNINAKAIEEIYPATHTQDSLFTLSKTNEGSYILQYAFNIPSSVDIQRLRESWLRVVDRIAILRTRFFETSSSLQQVVLAYDFDWHILHEDDSPKLRQRLKRQMGVDQKALSRFTMLEGQTGSPRTLIWTISHALTDGWSTSMILGAVRSAYRQVSVPSFKPFKAFVNSLSTASVSEAEQSFWKKELQGGPCAEFPILPSASFRPRTCASMIKRMPLIPQAPSRYTVPLLLRAAWALTVSSFSGSDDVLFGIVLNGRSNSTAGIDSLVGPMVATVPVRTNIRRDASVNDLLQQLNEQAVSMMRYEQTGLRRIAGLGPEFKELCMFQNILVIQVSGQHIAEEDQDLDWLDLKYMDADNVAAQALVFECTLEPASVRVRAKYDDEVVSENAMSLIIEQFFSIFTQIEQLQARRVLLKEIGAPQVIAFSSIDPPATTQRQNCVKYCGQIIDLDAVELEIGKHVPPGIECVVDLVKPRGDHEVASVAAFVVTSGGGSKLDFAVLATALRSKLEMTLPRHLIPAIFYPLEQKPLSFDGRAERRELQWLASGLSRDDLLSPSRTRGALRGAQSEVEEILIACWRRVLGAEHVSVDDNFIALGGDSVKVIRLVAAAKAAGLGLSVKAALNNLILRQMAACATPVMMRIDKNVEPFSLIGGTTAAKSLMLSICAQTGVDASAVEDILPCMPYQKHTFAMSLRSSGACVSQTRYHLKQDFDVDRFFVAWELVCRTFTNLRTRIVKPPGRDLTQVILTQYSPLEVTCHASGEEAESYLADIRKSASSLGSSLAHAAVIHVDGTSQVDKHSTFVWSMNHTIYDGHTIGTMWKALREAYWNGRINQEVTPYKHFADFVVSKDAAVSRTFWTQYLEGAKPSTFPTYPSNLHRPRPAVKQDYTIELVRKSGSPITTATILKVAWGMTVESYTSTKDVTFQGLLSGRDSDLDNIGTIAGPTLNYVPIRVPLGVGDSMSVPAFLFKMQEQDAGTIPHQALGIDSIAALNDETAKACDFHNMLVIHSREPEATAHAVPLGKYATYMDLTGFLGLFTQCTIMSTGVEISIAHDEEVLSASAVQMLFAKFSGFIKSLSSESQSETIGELRRAKIAI